MIDSWEGDPVSQFDEDFAEGFIGKYLLVGVTCLGVDGAVTQQEQMHGVILAATAHGIDVELRGAYDGVVWRMAPFLDELSPAKPGTYWLRSSQESVENPDFVFSMTIRSNEPH